MRFEPDFWDTLSPHVSASEMPPIAVYSAVAALVSPASIVASASEYLPEEDSTTWRVFAVTRASLAFVELSFDAGYFDARAEGDRHGVGSTVSSAWVRPQSAIIEYGLSEVGGHVKVESSGRWFPVEAHIKFSDGFEVVLPAQSRVPRDQRARSDEFLTTIRDAIAK